MVSAEFAQKAVSVDKEEVGDVVGGIWRKVAGRREPSHSLSAGSCATPAACDPFVVVEEEHIAAADEFGIV